MTEKLKQKIQEEVMKLPKEVQSAIGSIDWVKIIDEISVKYGFDESGVNDFKVETLLVLVDLVDPNLYTANIENALGTTKEESEQITNEVAEKIFIPVANAIEEKVKENYKDKKWSWQQSLNFITSGGSYSSLLRKEEERDPFEITRNTPQIDVKRKEDLRSRFTI